jgi:ureidoglycolate hydrolase
MTTSTSIALEPLSADAFAPFGQVIEASAASADDLAGDRFRAWGTDFSADGPVQVMLVHYDAQPLGIDRMERLPSWGFSGQRDAAVSPIKVL